MIKNILPDKSGNPESLKKNNRNSSKAFQLMCPWLAKICLARSTDCFIYRSVIQVTSQKTLCRKGFTSNLRHFYMKVVATIIPTDLVTNSLLYSFCPFLQTKNKNLVFSKLVVW